VLTLFLEDVVELLILLSCLSNPYTAVIAFITKKYVEKVGGDNDSDNCKYHLVIVHVVD
jgi:hypothetical protein